MNLHCYQQSEPSLSSTPPISNRKQVLYDQLPENEKQKVKELVYILDKFTISIHGYHELTQAYHQLPRTHYIEGCQQIVGAHYEILKTPGDAPGAEMDLVELLKHDKEFLEFTGKSLNVS